MLRRTTSGSMLGGALGEPRRNGVAGFSARAGIAEVFVSTVATVLLLLLSSGALDFFGLAETGLASAEFSGAKSGWLELWVGLRRTKYKPATTAQAARSAINRFISPAMLNRQCVVHQERFI